MNNSKRKVLMILVFHLVLGLIILGCSKKDETVNDELEPALPLVKVTADYSNVVSTFDKNKVLNVARGGHGINTDLTWMPCFYDKLVEIGVDEFRIDWLLSDWFYQLVSRNGNGELEYDFTKIDKIILPMA